MAVIFNSSDLKIEEELSSSGEKCFDIALMNFAIGSSELLPPHRQEIADRIIPFLQRDTAVAAIFGLASRSGSSGRNKELSADRMFTVANLVRVGISIDKLVDLDLNFFGEEFWESVGFADGTENNAMRAVVVYLWPDEATSNVVFADKELIKFARTHPLPGP